jgi:hypothetical protein
MTEREKLFELITIGGFFSRSADAEKCVDHLITNGVTVQKWIPVTERLPDKEGRYLCVVRIGKSGAVYVRVMNGDGFGFSLNRIYDDDVTHWMPLPKPPKEGP